MTINGLIRLKRTFGILSIIIGVICILNAGYIIYGVFTGELTLEFMNYNLVCYVCYMFVFSRYMRDSRFIFIYKYITHEINILDYFRNYDIPTKTFNPLCMLYIKAILSLKRGDDKYKEIIIKIKKHQKNLNLKDYNYFFKRASKNKIYPFSHLSEVEIIKLYS